MEEPDEESVNNKREERESERGQKRERGRERGGWEPPAEGVLVKAVGLNKLVRVIVGWKTKQPRTDVRGIFATERIIRIQRTKLGET